MKPFIAYGFSEGLAVNVMLVDCFSPFLDQNVLDFIKNFCYSPGVSALGGIALILGNPMLFSVWKHIFLFFAK